MTEADFSPRKNVSLGKARIKAHPGPELSLALQRFVNPHRMRELGGKVLELKSMQHLVLVEGARQAQEDIRRRTVTRAEFSELHGSISRHQQSVRPWISPDVRYVPLPPPENTPDDGNGIELRFHVQLNELTKRVLKSTVLLDSDDGELYLRFSLRRPDMVLGRELLEARDGLLEHLRKKVPEPLDSLYLHSPDMHG